MATLNIAFTDIERVVGKHSYYIGSVNGYKGKLLAYFKDDPKDLDFSIIERLYKAKTELGIEIIVSTYNGSFTMEFAGFVLRGDHIINESAGIAITGMYVGVNGNLAAF